jgi:cbb3-type cytochrome oxidase subunit 3
MSTLFWLAVCGFVACAIGVVWYVLRKFKERERAEAARAAEFLAATAGRNKLVEALPAAPAAAPSPVPAGSGLAQQKLLFEAAHKAGEAGEPALAIQLYARLLARFPESTFAGQARAAAEAQKKKVAKG